MQYSLRRLMLACLFASILFWSGSTVYTLKRDASHLRQKQLAKAASIPRIHPRAKLNIVLVPANRSLSSLFLRQVLDVDPANLNVKYDAVHSGTTGGLLSVSVHFVGTLADGDVYEVVIKEGGRLPPVAKTREVDSKIILIKTGAGKIEMYRSQTWSIELIDDGEIRKRGVDFGRTAQGIFNCHIA